MTPVLSPLTRAWLILMALCVVTLVLGLSDSGSPLGGAGVASLLLTTLVKARQVLLDFLELRHAGGGWRGGLTLWLVVVAGLILAVHAAGEHRLFGT